MTTPPRWLKNGLVVSNNTLTCAAVGVTPFNVSLASKLKPPPGLKVAVSALATATSGTGTTTGTLILTAAVELHGPPPTIGQML